MGHDVGTVDSDSGGMVPQDEALTDDELGGSGSEEDDIAIGEDPLDVADAANVVEAEDVTSEEEEEESDEDTEDATDDDDTSEEEEDPKEVLAREIGGIPEDAEGVPNTWIRDQFQEYVRHQKRHNYPLTDNEQKAINLMNIMRKKKTALNAYKDLMEWHLRESGKLKEYEQLKHCKAYIGRKRLLKDLTVRYNFAKKFPYKKKVKLPISGTVLDMTLHYTPAVMQQLLTDPRLETAECMHLDDDPLAPPPPRHTKIGGIQTAKAFRHTHRVVIDPSKREQLLPLILYIDGTAVTQFHGMELIPVKVSLGFWSRATRSREEAWGILGYIDKKPGQGGEADEQWKEGKHMEQQSEDGDTEDGSVYEELEGIGEKDVQDWHAQLEVILRGIRSLMKTGFLWDMKHKGKLYRNIHYKVFIPFVKCDNKEANDLCGKYQSGLRGVKCICRYCKCSVADAHDYRHQPVMKTEPEIKRMVERKDEARLQEISQVQVLNACHGLTFNQGNKRGIHGACPLDMLHTILLGSFKYVRTSLFAGTGGKPADKLNALSKQYSKRFKRQADKSMPPAKGFTKGIRVGKLMGKEFRGVLLVMLVMLHSVKGRSILRSSRSGVVKSRVKASPFAQIDLWILLIELLLIWEAYLQSDEMLIRDITRLDEKNRYLMQLIRKVAKRKKGMGWRLMKCHGILHLPEDILLYGVPLEFDTGFNEEHHKISKAAAKLTQHDPECFNYQTATRTTEFKLIQQAVLEVEEDLRQWEYYDGLVEEWEELPEDSDDSNDPVDMSFEVAGPEVTTGGTQLQVYRDEDGTPGFYLGGRSKNKDASRLTTEVLRFVCELQDKLEVESLDCFTEHTRDGDTFRGHPNYRGKGPWRDWVWIDFGGDGMICCHIFFFVVIKEVPPRKKGGAPLTHGDTVLKPGVYAVVESTKKVSELPDVFRVSELICPLEKEVDLDSVTGLVRKRKLFLADTEAIEEGACVVPNIGGPPNQYFCIESRKKWTAFGKEWVRSNSDSSMSDVSSDEEEVLEVDIEEEEDEEIEEGDVAEDQ